MAESTILFTRHMSFQTEQYEKMGGMYGNCINPDAKDVMRDMYSATYPVLYSQKVHNR